MQWIKLTDRMPNPGDLRCAEWVIAQGSAKRGDGDE